MTCFTFLIVFTFCVEKLIGIGLCLRITWLLQINQLVLFISNQTTLHVARRFSFKKRFYYSIRITLCVKRKRQQTWKSTVRYPALCSVTSCVKANINTARVITYETSSGRQTHWPTYRNNEGCRPAGVLTWTALCLRRKSPLRLEIHVYHTS